MYAYAQERASGAVDGLAVVARHDERVPAREGLDVVRRDVA
jgi:hypothetical protein